MLPGFNGETFGIGFHNFVTAENETLGPFLAPIFHITTIVLLSLVFRHGNRFRRFFTIYFTVQWAFLFGYWGIYGAIYWSQIGTVYLLMYLMTPILLGLVLHYWILELKSPAIDLNFRGLAKWRYWVMAVLVWGFWYPTYIYDQGFRLNPQDLVFSEYGLMPCPTTMVILSLLTLKYPQRDKRLALVLTLYALIIGSATVATGWIPDIPLIIIGVYSLVLIILDKCRSVTSSNLVPAKR